MQFTTLLVLLAPLAIATPISGSTTQVGEVLSTETTQATTSLTRPLDIDAARRTCISLIAITNCVEECKDGRCQ
jgi:hypothetical protein